MDNEIIDKDTVDGFDIYSFSTEESSKKYQNIHFIAFRNYRIISNIILNYLLKILKLILFF